MSKVLYYVSVFLIGISTYFDSKGKIVGNSIDNSDSIKYYDAKGRFLGEEIKRSKVPTTYDVKGKVLGNKGTLNMFKKGK